MFLNEAKPDEKYRLVRCYSGRAMSRRLHDMGMTCGCEFVVVVNSRVGPVLVEIRGTRLAIGNGMASKIEVEEVK